MGIPVVSYKLAAFAVAASLPGSWACCSPPAAPLSAPKSFNFMQSIGVLTMVILGGLGSIPGVILGAAVVMILNLQVLQGLSLWLSSLRQSDIVIPLINFPCSDISSQLDPAKYQRMLFGLILIVMMIYRPEGLDPGQAAQARAAGRKRTRADRRTTGGHIQPPVAERGGRPWRCLKPQAVTKRFGGLTAVDKMNFVIEQGQMVSIIGPNGAGKTTFFNTLTGIYKPEEGQIHFNGHSLIGHRPDQIASLGITRTFQNIRLFGSMTVIENILVGMHYRLKQIAGRRAAAQPQFSKKKRRGAPARRGADGLCRPARGGQ